ESVELNKNEELKNNFNNSFLDKKTNKDIVLLVENELRDIVNVANFSVFLIFYKYHLSTSF
ncbi:hypothetical protein ACTPEF_24910, partial [Clostridioides difficile]